MTKRRSVSDKFKATVGLEALRGDMTSNKIASKYKHYPTEIMRWKRQPIDRPGRGISR